MISIHKRWLVGVSFLVTASQFGFLAIGSSKIGTVVYKLMVLSLGFVDQSIVPTLRATREGWPLPTVFGYVLYALFSGVIIFLILWAVSALYAQSKKAPIQAPVPTRGSGT
jgi:hypothetical protein